MQFNNHLFSAAYPKLCLPHRTVSTSICNDDYFFEFLSANLHLPAPLYPFHLRIFYSCFTTNSVDKRLVCSGVSFGRTKKSGLAVVELFHLSHHFFPKDKLRQPCFSLYLVTLPSASCSSHRCLAEFPLRKTISLLLRYRFVSGFQAPPCPCPSWRNSPCSEPRRSK